MYRTNHFDPRDFSALIFISYLLFCASWSLGSSCGCAEISGLLRAVRPYQWSQAPVPGWGCAAVWAGAPRQHWRNVCWSDVLSCRRWARYPRLFRSGRWPYPHILSRRDLWTVYHAPGRCIIRKWPIRLSRKRWASPACGTGYPPCTAHNLSLIHISEPTRP